MQQEDLALHRLLVFLKMTWTWGTCSNQFALMCSLQLRQILLLASINKNKQKNQTQTNAEMCCNQHLVLLVVCFLNIRSNVIPFSLNIINVGQYLAVQQ